MRQSNQIIKVLIAVFIGATFISSLANAQQTNPNNLPPCPKDLTARYHNCFGTSRDSDGTGTGYTGTFKDNHPDGYGTYSSPRFEYVGEWKEGVMHGKGRFTSPEMTYEGETKEGSKHGWGTLSYSNGFKYEGQFQENRFHGMGSTTDIEGNKYEGNFKNNKRHGLGKYIFKNGTTYSGESKEGNFHGQGIYKTADGKKYEGVFENGKFIGTQDDIARSNRVKEQNNRVKEQNLSYPWRVQAQCITFDCQITRVEEYDRLYDGAVRFQINYQTGTRMSGFAGAAYIECGVGRSNKLNLSNGVTAACF